MRPEVSLNGDIDWIPLSVGSVRPTQGKTLGICQVNGGRRFSSSGANRNKADILTNLQLYSASCHSNLW
jgi:hypothetical protein